MTFLPQLTLLATLLAVAIAGSGEHWQQDPHLESFGGEPPYHKFPLSVCQGDCDEDQDVSVRKYTLIPTVTQCHLPMSLYWFSVHMGLHVFNEVAEV